MTGRAPFVLAVLLCGAAAAQTPAPPRPPQPAPPKPQKTPVPPRVPPLGGPPIITSRISGSVSDITGAAVPNADVKATNHETGATFTAKADSQGFYRIGVPAGTYDVDISSAGFAVSRQKGVVVAPQMELALATTKLEIGAAAIVAVSEPDITIDTTSSAITTPQSADFEHIPVSRTFMSVVAFAPGAASFESEDSAQTLQEATLREGFDAGARTFDTTTTVTKSGSNLFHGSLWDQWANDRFGARNALDFAGKSKVRSHRFGAQLGGPIVRNSLFFFGGYDGARARNGIDFLEAVPSDLARLRAAPSVAPWIAAYPRGTVPTGDPDLSVAQANLPRRETRDSGVARLDWNINPETLLKVEYAYAKSQFADATGVTSAYSLANSDPRSGDVRLDRFFTPSLANDTKLRWSGARFRQRRWAPVMASADFFGPPAERNATGAAALGGVWRQDGSHIGAGLAATDSSWTLSDTLSWMRGKHHVSAGFQGAWTGIYADRFGGAQSIYSNISDFLAGSPLFVTSAADLGIGSPRPGSVPGSRLVRQQTYSAFAQDDWRWGHDVTVTLGLRYEYASAPSAAGGQAVVFDAASGAAKPLGSAFYNVRPANFAPRAAIVWDPFGHGWTALRAGAGYYYSGALTANLLLPVENDRMVTSTSGGAAAYQPRAFSSDFRLPSRIFVYSASIQQRLPRDIAVSAVFQGRQGRNLLAGIWGNPVVSVATDPVTGLGRETRQFGPELAQFDILTSQGASQSHSLRTSVTRNVHALTAAAYWSWSHSIDSAPSIAQNPQNLRSDRGDSDFDVRHSLAASARYQLPFGRDWRFRSNIANALFGDWALAGALEARTGTPIEVTIARPNILYRDTQSNRVTAHPVFRDGALATVAVPNVPGGGEYRASQRPDLVPGVSPFLATSDRRYILNPAAFAVPVPGAFGNLGRNALHGPSFTNLNLTLLREARLTEKLKLRFTAEAFNLLNRANYANPSARMSSPGVTPGVFGVANSLAVQTTGAARQLEFGLRLLF